MHYYKKNIGDYHKKAGRLTMLQHGAYTLLMDACYDREEFPTIETALEWVWASSEAEIEAVKFVLLKFFDLIDGVYIQTRIERELESYQKNAKTNQRIALERESKRRQTKRLKDSTKREDKSTNREPTVNKSCETVNEPPPNYELLTKNQEPLTINQESNKDIVQKEICTALIEQGFDIFYSAGLIKKTKKKSFDKFKLLIKSMKADPVELGELLKKDIQIRIANNQFGIDRLHPATYLNQQRWEDSHEENVNGNANRGGKQSMQDRILEASGYGQHQSGQVMGSDGGHIRGAVDQGTRSETISYLDSQSEQAGRTFDQDGAEADY